MSRSVKPTFTAVGPENVQKTGPISESPFFGHISGPTAVNVGLTLPDIFFYPFRHDWPIKVTKQRLEYAFSNSQICPNFVGPGIASIES